MFIYYSNLPLGVMSGNNFCNTPSNSPSVTSAHQGGIRRIGFHEIHMGLQLQVTPILQFNINRTLKLHFACIRQLYTSVIYYICYINWQIIYLWTALKQFTLLSMTNIQGTTTTPAPRERLQSLRTTAPPLRTSKSLRMEPASKFEASNCGQVLLPLKLFHLQTWLKSNVL